MAVIFTKDRMVTDTFVFSTVFSKVRCFIFQPRLNTHIFKKVCNILAFKNIYAMYIAYTHVLSLYTYSAYTHLGSDNIGQMQIWAIIMFYQVVSIDHVNYT